MSRILTPEQVKDIVGDAPTMTLEQGRTLTRFIHAHGVRTMLELGIGHGVSACYAAAALASRGGGSLVSLDLASNEDRRPNAEQLLARCGNQDLVTIHRDPTSYTWHLMKMLREDPRPRFDLCYLDGAHNWFVDGFAFFLVDRLLRTGGWIIFDDLNWTYDGSPSLRDTDAVRRMPPDERETPQVALVYDLLVRTHPAYGAFSIKDGWGYARKLAATTRGRPTPIARVLRRGGRLLRRVTARQRGPVA